MSFVCSQVILDDLQDFPLHPLSYSVEKGTKNVKNPLNKSVIISGLGLNTND